MGIFALGGCDCFSQPPDVTPIDGGGIPCIVNSDCGDNSFCGDGGFCLAGLPPGTCQTEGDCEDEEICVFPGGSDVGACLNPHECTTADDCQDGQVCEDGNGDGFRDCLFAGCEDDAECVDEVGATCTVNEEAKCIARACLCRDLCGADCGEGNRCCAVVETTAICIADPGPCAMLDCEPGFGGVTQSFGEWEAPSCDYADSMCSCAELPPLPEGSAGTPHRLVTHSTGRTYAVAYNDTYGDVAVAEVLSSPITGWVTMDGVPPASEETPIVAGPSGPRGGIAEPGDDVGLYLDAAITSNNILHVVARDQTNGNLRHIYGPPSGPFTSVVLDADGETGYAPRIVIDDQDRVVVAHVVRNNGAGRSELRILTATSPELAPANWISNDVATLALSQVACQGGCDDGFVCPEPANVDDTPLCVPQAADCGICDDLCTATGCEPAADAAPFVQSLVFDSLALILSGNDVLVFGHDPRAGELAGYLSSGDLFAGNAAFSLTRLLTVVDENVGARPAVTRGGGGFYVASTDISGRRLTLLETSASLAVIGTEVEIDDGQRPDPSGAVARHAVDNAALALDDSGEGVIAWQDGTTGAVWGRWLTTGGVLGAPQILGGAGIGSSYQGFHGFSVAVAMPAQGPVVTTQRTWLAADPVVSELVRLPAPARCPDDDLYEENDDVMGAAPISTSDAITGIICPDDEDFYEIDVSGSCQLSAELIFRDAAGDLDLRLLDAAETVLDSSLTVSDYEFVEAMVTPGLYTFRITGFNSAENGYALRVELDCTAP